MTNNDCLLVGNLFIALGFAFLLTGLGEMFISPDFPWVYGVLLVGVGIILLIHDLFTKKINL